MAEVEIDERAFNRTVTEAVANRFTGRNNLFQQAIEQSHERLRSFSDQYDVEPIIDSLVVPRAGLAVDPEAGEIDMTWEWRHPAAEFFDTGTSNHTIDGDPVLSFIWEDAPEEVRAMFPHTERDGGDPRVFFEEVTVKGINETAFARHGLRWLRRQLKQEFS